MMEDTKKINLDVSCECEFRKDIR